MLAMEVGATKRKHDDTQREAALALAKRQREEDHGHIVSLLNTYTMADTALLFVVGPTAAAALNRATELLTFSYGLPREGGNWRLTGVGPRLAMSNAALDAKTGLRSAVVGVQLEGRGMQVEDADGTTMDQAWEQWLHAVPEEEAAWEPCE